MGLPVHDTVPAFLPATYTQESKRAENLVIEMPVRPPPSASSFLRVSKVFPLAAISGTSGNSISPAVRHPQGIPPTLTQRDLRTAGCTTFQDPSNAPQSKTYNECVSEFGFPAKPNEWKK